MPPRKNSPKERMTLTKLGTLMEKLSSDFKLFGEELTPVRRKVDALEKRVANIESRLDIMEPILKTLARDMDELKKDVRGSFQTFDQRLTTVEAK